jgi:catechol 2,3-dioxygenase-like lactoylglutathione lyase family enzyme
MAGALDRRICGCSLDPCLGSPETVPRSSLRPSEQKRGSEVSWSSKSVDFITLFVEDLDQSKAFYQHVFGLPLVYQDESSAVFRFQNTGINLLKVAAARDLVKPGSVASPEAGSRLLFTISVDDVDAVCAELARHAVKLLNGPVDRPWGVRTASFSDPGGHLWEIAQALPSGQ